MSCYAMLCQLDSAVRRVSESDRARCCPASSTYTLSRSVENISLHSVYDTTKCKRDGDMLTAGPYSRGGRCAASARPTRSVARTRAPACTTRRLSVRSCRSLAFRFAGSAVTKNYLSFEKYELRTHSPAWVHCCDSTYKNTYTDVQIEQEPLSPLTYGGEPSRPNFSPQTS
jgi:hypothetical protein